MLWGRNVMQITLSVKCIDGLAKSNVGIHWDIVVKQLTQLNLTAKSLRVQLVSINVVTALRKILSKLY